MSKPRVVKSHDINLDSDYTDWIVEVKRRYRSTQVKAAVKVNSEQLLFNWQLCRDFGFVPWRHHVDIITHCGFVE